MLIMNNKTLKLETLLLFTEAELLHMYAASEWYVISFFQNFILLFFFHMKSH